VGSIGAHIDKFAEFLAGEGYASQTVKAKYALVAELSHWLKQHGVPLAKLDEARLKQFHAHHRDSRGRGDVSTGHQLFEAGDHSNQPRVGRSFGSA
jgi:site-specific recombinase XerD